MNGEKLRLLIVDDEDPIRRAFKMMFRRHFDVTLAADGQEALDLLLKDDFDVVLSDYYMPNMTGQALFEKLEEVKPEAAKRMVFMSGNPNNGPAGSFFRNHDCLEKPFDKDEALYVLSQAALGS
jgi:two-component system response regulator ResD